MLLYDMGTSTRTTSVLSVRVNPSEKAVLEAAAAEEHTTLSDFMRRMAVQAAETALFHRNVVSIPAQDWEAFEAWIGGPPVDNSGLAAIAKRAPSWER
jgi:uncharacterized protein (DUF1778 family)